MKEMMQEQAELIKTLTAKSYFVVDLILREEDQYRQIAFTFNSVVASKTDPVKSSKVNYSIRITFTL